MIPLDVTQVLPPENRDVARRVAGKREREEEALERKATQDAFADDLAALIRILRTRDNLPVTERHISERVANGLTAFFGNFKIERLR